MGGESSSNEVIFTGDTSLGTSYHLNIPDCFWRLSLIQHNILYIIYLYNSVTLTPQASSYIWYKARLEQIDYSHYLHNAFVKISAM